MAWIADFNADAVGLSDANHVDQSSFSSLSKLPLPNPADSWSQAGPGMLVVPISFGIVTAVQPAKAASRMSPSRRRPPRPS